VLFEELPYQVVRCKTCSCTYVTPQRQGQALLDELYEERLWSSPAPRHFGYAAYREEAENYLRTFAYRLHALERASLPRTGGRLLDVGCAAGYFLTVMQQRGWQVEGVEPSRTIARFGRERFGVTIHEGTLDTIKLPPASYDLITLWDVIEHVPDPTNLLLQVRRLLAPGGVVLLETQNVASLTARVLGRRWHHYKHAEHLWHFSPQTIDLLLQKTGFVSASHSSKYAGKFVPLSFIAERAARLSTLLSRTLTRGVRLVGDRALYVNVHDEMIVLARAKEGEGV
jgi:2-polyprenyl-3-methyl-5-hydroxy-6-metoxy-1,4-benzoquinol methylase